MTDHEDLMKRCQRGATNLNDANNLLADCYGMLGKLGAENEALRKDKSEPCDGCFMADAESLRKDAERLKKATEFVQRLCDSAGKQPSVATGYLHDILSAMSKEG